MRITPGLYIHRHNPLDFVYPIFLNEYIIKSNAKQSQTLKSNKPVYKKIKRKPEAAGSPQSCHKPYDPEP